MKWFFVALLLGSIVAVPKIAEARCCCNHDYWSYYPGDGGWTHGWPYSVRQRLGRYHYPTWKFDQAAGKWRRIAE